MALIKCRECGKEISEQANVCPNCGCPINRYTQQQPVNNKKQSNGESALSILSIIFTVLICTSPVGFILSIIDLCINNKSKKHVCSWISFSLCILLFLGFIVISLSDFSSSSSSSSEKQLDILLCEDENMRIYIDHIKNGQIFLKVCNDSDENLNFQYTDLTINGDRYYRGIFCDEVYSNDEDIIKLNLYDKDGTSQSYNYDSGTIKGKFSYFGSGISFDTTLAFEDTEF